MKAGRLLYEIAEESFTVITRPGDYWKRIDAEKDSVKTIISRYFIPVLSLIFLAVILGDLMFDSQYGVLLKYTVIKALRKVLMLVMIYFASTMIIYEVSRWHRIPVTFDLAGKIILYSMAPLVVVMIVTSIFPFLDVVGVLGLYSLYLVYSAIVNIYKVKPERNIGYFLILISGMLITYMIISLLLNKLTALIIF